MAGMLPIVFSNPGQPVILPPLVSEGRFLDFYAMMERLVREALARGAASPSARS